MKKLKFVVFVAMVLFSVEAISQNTIESPSGENTMLTGEKSFTLKPVSQNKNIEAFPNPFVSKIKVTGINDFSGTISVENFQGELLEVHEINNSDQLVIDAKEWSAGIYFIKFINSYGEMLTIKKLVKRF